MMHRSIRLLGFVAAFAVLGGCGITGNLRWNPGYAGFASPGMRDTDRGFALSLGVLPLRIARTMTRDDPELFGALKSLKAVRVYIYEIDGDEARVRERIESTRARLVDEGWEPVVAVRDDGEFVTALVRMGGSEVMHGLTVMLQDSEEVVFVNLIGNIRPDTFAFVMDEIGIDAPKTRIETL